MICFQKRSKSGDTLVLYGTKEKSNLVIVCQLAGILEACNKSKDFLMPFILVIHTDEFHNGRTADGALGMRLYLFLIAIFIPVEFELGTICCGHPFIVKIDNIAV